MKRTIVLLALALLAFSSPLYAQTVTQTLEWDHLGATLAATQGYVTTIKVNTAQPVLTTPSCVTAGPNVHCATPLNPPVKSGDTVTVTVLAPNGVQANGAVTYAPGAPPIGPTNIVITIKITVP